MKHLRRISIIKNHTALPVGHNNMHLYQMMQQRDVCVCMLGPCVCPLRERNIGCIPISILLFTKNMSGASFADGNVHTFEYVVR